MGLCSSFSTCHQTTGACISLREELKYSSTNVSVSHAILNASTPFSYAITLLIRHDFRLFHDFNHIDTRRPSRERSQKLHVVSPFLVRPHGQGSIDLRVRESISGCSFMNFWRIHPSFWSHSMALPIAFWFWSSSSYTYVSTRSPHSPVPSHPTTIHRGFWVPPTSPPSPRLPSSSLSFRFLRHDLRSKSILVHL